jgi:hypothetical protein
MQEENVDMLQFTFLNEREESRQQQQQQKQQSESSKAPSFSPPIATRDPVLTTAAITSRTGELALDFGLDSSILNAPSGITPLPSTSHLEEPQQVHNVTPRRVSKLALILLLK